jgi:hypothetical protein
MGMGAITIQMFMETQSKLTACNRPADKLSHVKELRTVADNVPCLLIV